jgi:hypothetical protein
MSAHKSFIDVMRDAEFIEATKRGREEAEARARRRCVNSKLPHVARAGGEQSSFSELKTRDENAKH